ncbi:MAG: hypothetical protein J5842_09235, partial [Lachnospiraceae bacterium]|nr:hypothetical protein [Lachnospiraceae bacterium]
YNDKLKAEDERLLGNDAKGLTYEEYKNACSQKIKQDDINEKLKIANEKNERRKEMEMDKEYIKYLNRITSSKKISPSRRTDLLMDFYTTGTMNRPISEEVEQMIDPQVKNKAPKPAKAL